MTEPVLSRVQIAPFADVLILAHIDNAPDITTSPDRTLRPQLLEITYYFDFGALCWVHKVTVTGPRVARDGTVGTSPRTARYARGDELPEWLTRIVNDRRPTFGLPDMRVLGV